MGPPSGFWMLISPAASTTLTTKPSYKSSKPPRVSIDALRRGSEPERSIKTDSTPQSQEPPIVSGSIFAWRWSFQMQAVNMGDQFSFRGPATEVEAEHLIRPLGR